MPSPAEAIRDARSHLLRHLAKMPDDSGEVSDVVLSRLRTAAEALEKASRTRGAFALMDLVDAALEELSLALDAIP